MDIVSRAKRSEMMSRVKRANTMPELAVRSLLHRLGYRFRLHSKDLPGRPDIVLPGRRSAVFVHGCFWHRHKNCPDATMPRTRRDFWENKLADNVTRDEASTRALVKLGWRYLIVWECELRDEKHVVAKLKEFLR